ncbi:helix-turn-helix domain-containing protein [Candidatus Neomarinimicrobiota bacterium]
MSQTDHFYYELKQLRVAQGISLENISEQTRINIRFLEALENGEFDILPKTYVRLFLRSYCQSIGASEEETLQQLEEHLGESEDEHTVMFEELSTAPIVSTEKETQIDLKSKGPARMRRDFLAGAAIFLVLIAITFFARRAYQGPGGDMQPVTTESQPATAQTFGQDIQSERDTGVPASAPAETFTDPSDIAPVRQPARRSQPVIPEEATVDLPDALFAEDRIVSHHMERVRLTPPIRLTLMARDNVVIQPVSGGQRGPSINLTVAEARIWTIYEDLILRTPSVELLRGDLNGIPINLGQARGLGAIRITPTGEYEVFSYGEYQL